MVFWPSVFWRPGVPRPKNRVFSRKEWFVWPCRNRRQGQQKHSVLKNVWLWRRALDVATASSTAPNIRHSLAVGIPKCFAWRPGAPRPNKNTLFWKICACLALVPQASKKPLGQKQLRGASELASASDVLKLPAPEDRPGTSPKTVIFRDNEPSRAGPVTYQGRGKGGRLGKHVGGAITQYPKGIPKWFLGGLGYP